VVRRVAGGQVITITDRGRPVARIVPIRDDEGWWDEMIEEGRIIPARRDLHPGAVREPTGAAGAGERSPFDALMELRAGEV